jgi:hypothetical protein
MHEPFASGFRPMALAFKLQMIDRTTAKRLSF